MRLFYDGIRCIFSRKSKKSTGYNLIENTSIIVPDITQRHFELKIQYDQYFKEYPNRFVADDIRLSENEIDSQTSYSLIQQFIAKEKFNNNLNIEKLLTINRKIKNFGGNNVYVYIDGSVVNSGSEIIMGIAGLNFYDNDHNLFEDLYVTVENWITPMKTEVYAFLFRGWNRSEKS